MGKGGRWGRKVYVGDEVGWCLWGGWLWIVVRVLLRGRWNRGGGWGRMVCGVEMIVGFGTCIRGIAVAI